MPSRVRVLAAASVSAVLALPAAHASTFTATDLSYDNALLSQFNLVSLGNLTQAPGGTNYLTIQGRAIVGGNATFNTYTSGTAVADPSVCTVNCAGNARPVDSSGAALGALTVFGNVTTPGNINGTPTFVSVGSGDVSVRGTGAAGTTAITGNLVLNTAGNGAKGSLAVVGAVAGNNGSNVSNASAVRTSQASFAGGNYTTNSAGQVTGNGPAAQVNQAVASVFPFSTAYQASVTSLAQGIANLPGTPGVKAQNLPSGNAAFFTANADYTAGGLSHGVVTTTLANLASQTGGWGINDNGNAATFVIVSGDGANYVLPNLNSYAGANSVIFDFVNATTLKFAGNWNGNILAPLATITQQGGAINGSVIVASIAQSNALNDGAIFSGNLGGLTGISTSVPEPASLLLLGTGLAAAAAIRRRRR